MPEPLPTKKFLCASCAFSWLIVPALECKPGSAEQARVVTTLSAHYLTTPSGNWKSASHNFIACMLRKQIPRRRDATANHNHFRIEDVDDVRHRNTEMNSNLHHNIERNFIARKCGPIDVL